MKKPGTTKYSLDLIRPSHLHSSLAILQHVTSHHCLLHWEWPGAGNGKKSLWSWSRFCFFILLHFEVVNEFHAAFHRTKSMASAYPSGCVWIAKCWRQSINTNIGTTNFGQEILTELVELVWTCWGNASVANLIEDSKNIELHAAPASLCGSSWRGSRWVRFWCFDVSQQSMNIPRML